MQNKFLKKTKNIELAYFAGLIDGEAHIGLARQRRTDRDGRIRFIPRICLSMLKKESNENVLLEIRNVFGGSLFIRNPFEYLDRKRITHKQQICWEIRNIKAIDALRRLRPYLRIKRDHANIILALDFKARYRISESESNKREYAYWKIRTLNDSRRSFI